jgi:hypothetical protein
MVTQENIYIADIVKSVENVVNFMKDNVVNASDIPPYFMFGTPLEIAGRLLEKDEDMNWKYKKYPLIALRLPVVERVKGTTSTFKLNIAIINESEVHWTADERMSQNVRPILYPLYNQFLVALFESGIFQNATPPRPEHTRVDRLYWGTQYAQGNEKNIFQDPIDAVELIDLLVVQNLTC